MSIIVTHEVVNKHTQQTYRVIVQDPIRKDKYRWLDHTNGILYGVKMGHPQLLLEHYKGADSKNYYIRPIEPTDVDYYYKSEESDDEMTEETNGTKTLKRKSIPVAKELIEPELNDNEKAFKSIVDEMFKVYKAKNHDYGNSVQDTYDRLGDASFLTRILDKVNRLVSLTQPGKEAQVKDEAIEDTILDLANYAVLYKMTREARNK